jgi:DNA repair protein RAD50
MRGRCSAGQKVLASIIIRLALAEEFCNQCGILCLDEPTINLDKDHVISLADSIRSLIEERKNDSKFQLVIITHDLTFLDAIGAEYCDVFYEVTKKNGYSNVELSSLSDCKAKNFNNA